MSSFQDYNVCDLLKAIFPLLHIFVPTVRKKSTYLHLAHLALLFHLAHLLGLLSHQEALAKTSAEEAILLDRYKTEGGD